MFAQSLRRSAVAAGSMAAFAVGANAGIASTKSASNDTAGVLGEIAAGVKAIQSDLGIGSTKTAGVIYLRCLH